MEAPRSILGRQKRRARWFRWVNALAAVAVLIVIIVPLAVILPGRRHVKGMPSTALIPLYAYPTAEAWEPLFRAIDSSTNLNFIVIVNVDSGPGDIAGPNEDFIPGIQRLNAYDNVQTVGYVRTGYGNRPVQSIKDDVKTYGRWSKLESNLTMHGIFFDEVPGDYEPGLAEMLTEINMFAKNATGIGGKRTVIHNPGVPPDMRLAVDLTDITVVVEESLNKYRGLCSLLEMSPLHRGEKAYMVHSAGSGRWARLVPEMSHHAAYLFLTQKKEDYYGGFGSDLQEFVNVMPNS